MSDIIGPGIDLIKFHSDEVIEKLPESILDLGCGDPKSFYFLHDQKQCIKRYCGIDNGKESCIYFHSNSYIEYCDLIENNQLNIEDFKTLFDIRLEINLFDFLEKCDEKFDLVVLSDVLHLTDIKVRWKEVLRLAKERLNQGGMMYVKVMDSNYIHYANDSRYSLFTETEIKELEMLSTVKRCVYNHWAFLIRF